MEPVWGSSSEGPPFVLWRAAATLDLVGSHLLHSILPSLFRRSPLTETPLTAFRVHRLLPSLLEPQPSETGFRDRASPPLRRLGELRLDCLDLAIDPIDLLLVPWHSIEVIDSHSDARLASEEAGNLAADPSG